ncbi:hypothetical protein PQR57_44210 [Paraburkholderia dipogonis]|uniref:EAL domain-containing protein n=1 Tax=Paraburkholderia dipogonis TaxID=1211383 RepID=A0ABW9B7R3_9BURK
MRLLSALLCARTATKKSDQQHRHRSAGRHCSDLRRAGFRLALDDVSQVTPRLAELLPCVDIVKIDFLDCTREDLNELVSIVRQHGKVLLAEKVETPEDHDVAMRAGFDLLLCQAAGADIAASHAIARSAAAPAGAAVRRTGDCRT